MKTLEEEEESDSLRCAVLCCGVCFYPKKGQGEGRRGHEIIFFLSPPQKRERDENLGGGEKTRVCCFVPLQTSSCGARISFSKMLRVKWRH